MSYFIIYLIKSTVYLALFYVFFLTVMRGTTFFRFNRYMLLAGTFVCMLLPLHTVTVDEVKGIQLPIQILDEMLVMRTAPETEEETTLCMTLPVQESNATAPVPPLPYLLAGIYLTGVTVFLIAAIRSFRAVWKLIASHPKQWKDGCWLVVVPHKIPSFSWSNYIVMNREDYENYPQIMIHERMHYLCRHSYDMLFITLINAIHWFNPMVWLMRNELKQLHEFEADEGVIHQGIDATQYQLLLVRKAVGKKLYNIANGFNHTKLKTRITMMIKERTNGWERLKWLIVIPVVMGAMLIFAQSKKEQTKSLEYYKEYFSQETKRYNFFKASRGYTHTLNIDHMNRAYFDDKNVSSPETLRSALSKLIQHLHTNSEEESHYINFQYEPQVSTQQLCAYLQEIKDIYEEEKLIPLVYLNDPSYAQGEHNKRYYGIEVTLNGKEQPLKNFTAYELANAVIHATPNLIDNKHIRVGFRATKDQRMENINEVRRLLRDLYSPQQVIFRQTILP